MKELEREEVRVGVEERKKRGRAKGLKSTKKIRMGREVRRGGGHVSA